MDEQLKYTPEHIAGVDHAHELLRRMGYHRDGDWFIHANRRGAEAIHISTISTIVNAGQLALTTPQPAQAGEVDERAAFEQWYVEHCPDITCEPIGSRLFTLQWEAYQAGRASMPTQPAAQDTPEHEAESAGLEAANGHLSALLDESTQMLAQLRAMVDALHNQWSNGGAPERGEYPLLDRVDDWLGARPSEMVYPKQATPEPSEAEAKQIIDELGMHSEAVQSLKRAGFEWNPRTAAWEKATQQAAGEPVAWRWMPSHVFPMWVYSDDQNRVADARRFMGDGGVQALYTHPAPGVPDDSALLDYLDTLAARPVGSDLHCVGGRVVLYVRTGIGSQVQASGSGSAREAIRSALLTAAQAKGGQA